MTRELLQVVERMRMGDSPTRACEHAIERLRSAGKLCFSNLHISTGRSCNQKDPSKVKTGSIREDQKLTVGIIAMNAHGDIGASSTLGTWRVC
eukprot:768522-Hanusia_phi.AAC.3